MGIVSSLSDPNIAKHLLREEGEVIVDEVRHHWVAYLKPAIEAVAALALLVGSPFVNFNLAWLMLIVAFPLLILHADLGRAVRAPRPLRGDQHAGVPDQWRADVQPGHDAAAPDPRHRREEAPHRTGPGVRPLRLRVRRARTRTAGHPVRRPTRRAGQGDPAGRPAVGPSRPAHGELGERSGPMTLPFDPIDEAARQWGDRWDGIPDAGGHLADAGPAARDRAAGRFLSRTGSPSPATRRWCCWCSRRGARCRSARWASGSRCTRPRSPRSCAGSRRPG